MKRSPLKRTEFKRTAKKTASKPRPKPRGRARPDELLSARCEALVAPDCCRRAEHRHHVLLRSAGGGDEAANTLDVCRPCHEWIHAHPAQSYELDLLRRRS